jgi:hypothetical protein
MTLRVVYRSAQSPGKNRPAFFDPILGLRSFLRSLAALREDVHVTFLNDGPVAEERVELMRGAGEIVCLDGLGNSGSHRQALALLERTAGDDDLVYVVEDDYLHLEEALPALVAAAAELPQADYLTLYRDPPGYHGRDDRDRRPLALTAVGRRWTSVESTTMTFAARMGVLRRDSWIQWLGTQKPYPADRAIWLVTQGLAGHRLLGAAAGVDIPAPDRLAVRHLVRNALPGRRARRRLLVSPDPPLATHAEAGVLAPGVDWAAFARAL